MRRIVVGISGASGMPLALVLLQALRTVPDVEVHLIISDGAREVLRSECLKGADGPTPGDDGPLRACAHCVHDVRDIGAGPASGSWPHHGMIVCPCSMSTLAAIATGVGHNLLHRAADVTLKERRPLVLVPRETPLSRVHLRNMLDAQEAGAVIMPPCPAFYGQPQSIQDLLEHMAGRILDQLALPHLLGHRWKASPAPTLHTT